MNQKELLEKKKNNKYKIFYVSCHFGLAAQLRTCLAAAAAQAHNTPSLRPRPRDSFFISVCFWPSDKNGLRSSRGLRSPVPRTQPRPGQETLHLSGLKLAQFVLTVGSNPTASRASQPYKSQWLAPWSQTLGHFLPSPFSL